MANADSLSAQTGDAVSNYRLAIVRGATLNTAGNGATTGIVLPLLGGGLTNSGNAATSGAVIVRRITVQNPSGSIASANITVCQYNNSTTNVVSAQVLSNVSAANTFQDISPATPVVVPATNTSTLYVTVNTASGNNNTVDIVVWGDVVKF
jgi:hypothetical protein